MCAGAKNCGLYIFEISLKIATSFVNFWMHGKRGMLSINSKQCNNLSWNELIIDRISEHHFSENWNITLMRFFNRQWSAWIIYSWRVNESVIMNCYFETTKQIEAVAYKKPKILKTKENLKNNRCSQGRDLNPDSNYCELEMLITKSRYSDT